MVGTEITAFVCSNVTLRLSLALRDRQQELYYIGHADAESTLRDD